MARNIVPREDKGADLGTPAKRWNTIYADAVIATSVQGDNLGAVEQSAGDEVTLRNIITNAGSNPTSIMIYDDIPITSANLTIPSNIHLYFKDNGRLSPADGITLTINGNVSAGPWQIFDGDGVVIGTPKIAMVYPEWFGAVGDGIVDDTSSLQAAINFVSGGGHIHLTRVYAKSAELFINSSNIEISAVPGSKILDTAEAVNGFTIGTGYANIIFKGLQLFGSPNTTDTTVGILCEIGSHDITFYDCYFSGYSMGSLWLGDNYNMTVENCKFYNMVYSPTVLGNGYGLLCVSSYNTKIINNYFDASVYRHHIYMHPNPNAEAGSVHAENHIISGNIFMGQKSGTYMTGWESRVEIRGQHNVTISGNVFDGGVIDIVLLYCVRKCENITITGNVFKNLYKGNSSVNYFITEQSTTMDTTTTGLNISNNTFDNSDGPVFSAYALENAVISNNVATNLGTSSRVIEILYEAKNIKITGNNFNSEVTECAIYIGHPDVVKEKTNIEIKDNYLRSTAVVIIIHYGSTVYIKNNICIKGIPNADVIQLLQTAFPFNGIISDNVLLGGVSGIRIEKALDDRAYVYDNKIDAPTTPFPGTQGCYLVKPRSCNWPRMAVETTGSAAPTSGTWQRGDIVWNDFSSTESVLGWVCTADGTPGTWQSYGAKVV